MPKTSASQKTTIAPDVAERLRALLSSYFDLKQQADLLEAQMDEEKAKVWDIFKAEGVKSANIDGTSCTVIEGTVSYLDKVEFVTLGGDLALYDQATKTKPKKAYIQIGKDKSQ